MQWLIDLIKDWVNAQGFLSTAYVDRGDPADKDFAIGDLTVDYAWHDLDLSAIVPDGAKAIQIQIIALISSTTKFAYLRKKGNTNTRNVTTISTQVINKIAISDTLIACDTDRIIEYKIAAINFISFDILIRGWIF